MGLAAAPLNWWWLAWVAIMPLWRLAAAEQVSPNLTRCFYFRSSTFYLPLLWGLGFYGLTLAWITGLHPLTWLGVPWLASIAIALFCWGFITLWGTALPVLWLLLLRWLNRVAALSPLRRVLVGTALWCGLEWLWSQGALGWTNVAFTQSPGNLVILHLGQVSGPFTVTAAIVAVNGLLAEGLGQVGDRRQATGGKRQEFRLGAIALLVFLLSHLVGYALSSQALNDSMERAVKIGVIQGNVPTQIKLTSAGIQRAELGYTEGYEALAAQGVEAVLTPEGALPFIWQPTEFAKTSLYHAIAQRQVPLWLGTFFPDADGLARSLVTLDAKGAVISRYDKIKLVPLGEYTPFASVLGGLIGRLSPVQENGKPGTLQQQLDTPFGRAIAALCYDSAFPPVFQAQAHQGGQFILAAANLDPYSEILMVQYEAQNVMRAIETSRWLVSATNTGYSGLIDPHGEVHWRSQPYIYQTRLATIYRRTDKTLYVEFGNWLIPLLVGIAVITWAHSLSIKNARRSLH